MFGKIKATAKAVAGRTGDVLAAGFEKLKGPVDELSAASPDLEQVGYQVAEIELECGLIPRVIVHLSRQFDAGPEAFQAALASHAGNRTFCSLVRLLRQAERVVGKVQFRGRRCTGLAVELGIPPCVRLRYAAPDPRPAPPEVGGEHGVEPASA
jgi:hypothetical protein